MPGRRRPSVSRHHRSLLRLLVAATTLWVHGRGTAAPTIAPAVDVPVCRPWCADNVQPWTDKCRWPASCGGCPACDNVVNSAAPTMAPSVDACHDHDHHNDPAATCEPWCAPHPQPWSEKCGWPRSCGGCADCDDAAVVLDCKPWCAVHPTPWRRQHNDDTSPVKCNWVDTCAGCPACDVLYCVDVVTHPLEFGCDASYCHTAVAVSVLPWTDDDPTVEQRCGRGHVKFCGACPECRVSTTEIVSSVPSLLPSVSMSMLPSISLLLPPSSTPSNYSTIPTPSPTEGCKRWCANHPAPWDYDPQGPADQGTRFKCRWPVNCGGCPQCRGANAVRQQQESGYDDEASWFGEDGTSSSSASP